jgi:hypothetical protein
MEDNDALDAMKFALDALDAPVPPARPGPDLVVSSEVARRLIELVEEGRLKPMGPPIRFYDDGE